MVFCLGPRPPENSLTYPYEQVLASISLSAERRLIIEERYLRLLRLSHRRCRNIACAFHTNRLIITIGSIIVPALLSIQYTDAFPAAPFTQAVHWTAWILSLCVTISNGIMTMFKLDKKYYLFHASFEQLKTEGWQYLALAGHYRASGENSAPENSHEVQFIPFCQTIERIRMRQMEEEYIKLQEIRGQDAGRREQFSQGIPDIFEYQRTPRKNDLLHQFFTFLKAQYEAVPQTENSIVEIGVSHGASTKENSETESLSKTTQKGPTLP